MTSMSYFVQLAAIVYSRQGEAALRRARLRLRPTDIDQSLLKLLEGAELKAREDGIALHLFAPYIHGHRVERLITRLEELFPSTRGFSGGYRVADRADGASRFHVWGDEEGEIDFEGELRCQRYLRPSWTEFGVHVDSNDINVLLGTALGQLEVEQLSQSVMPEIRGLLQRRAQELGLVTPMLA